MTPRKRLAHSRFKTVPGYPDLELDSESGIYYVRKYLGKGRGELFRSTKQKTVGKASTEARILIEIAMGQKRGMKKHRIQVWEVCDLLLKELKEQTEMRDENGQLLRRLSTYVTKDVPFLRGKMTEEEKRRSGRKKLREQGVIRELFGDYFVDEIDEQFWKAWVKNKGRTLGRNLGDIAKYLSHVMSYAYLEKYLGRKPTISYTDKPKKKTAYPDEQIIAFFENAEPDLQDMVVLNSENPLRPHEVREMRWDFLHFTKDQVIYEVPEWFAKIGESRELILSANSFRVLKRRKSAKAKSPFVFPAPKNPEKPMSKVHLGRMWRRMKKKAGLSLTIPMKFTWLRHSLYTKLLIQMGLPIGQVSAAGGTSMKTLEKNYLIKDAGRTQGVASAGGLGFKLGEEE
jgi:integrase